MSIYKNGKLVAGGRQCMPLLSFMWADHILNDPSWLRADTFSWQSGAVYQAAYAHLVLDIDGKTLQSETIGSTTVRFYLADDGHKICPDTEESNVTAIYTATGVAWYYILDTVNQRFKLPRVEANKENILTDALSVKGTIGQSSVSGNAKYVLSDTQSGNIAQNTNPGSGGYSLARSLDQTIDGMTVDLSVQDSYFAGNKYLYFYVGSFTQTALENTAGLNTELFNGKADLNLANVLANIDFVVEKQEPTAANNYTWYRKYRSGWVEQGQTTLTVSDSVTTYTLLIEMESGYYNLCFGFNQSSDGTTMPSTYNRTTTTFSVNSPTGNVAGWWQVSGMAA